MATKKTTKKATSKARTSKASTAKSGAKKATTRKKTASSKKAKSSKGSSVSSTGGKVVVSREIGGRTLTLETGRMAKLSDGAVLARYGDTVVFAAANSSKAPDFMDFFPLTVDYREKTSAAGIIPGGFFKREGRPSTKEILTCRIIDRSIRPMFPDGFRRDVQVLSQCIASDRENDGDILAAIASFAALAVSSLPHGRSLGAVRMGYIDGELVVNPLWSQLQSEENKLNLVVAGHSDAVVMVEAGAKEVKEDIVLEALAEAHAVIKEIVDMVEELAEQAGKEKMEFEAPVKDTKLIAKIEKACGKALRKAPTTVGPKAVRAAAIKAAKNDAMEAFPAPSGSSEAETKAWEKKIGEIIGSIVKQGERESILDGVRADGRDPEKIRDITIEVGVLPRVHGSVLFTRGETQALGVVTLGGTDDQQIIDGLMPEPRKRFLLHYAFPPFSVGETKRMLAPGRREIGHGALAERGLEPLLPNKEDFPYTIRVTSEIMESNGSSSMATACAGTLSMMDAGVPIKQPVAGIAMGLVMEGKDYAVLSDILGSEDACGDMDFKVVGTGRGITALQMDIKCEGLTREILAEALDQAKDGRLHILREMLKALRSPRQKLSPNAPRLESVQVPSEKIGLIIGPGGKNIRQMQEEYECKISIEDNGMCTITGVNGEKVEAAVNHVKAMTAEIELGTTYEGRVTAIKEFGAFVEILPGQEGLVHVSELSNDFIRAVTDVVRIGDTVKVKVIAIDDFGKVKLSRKALLEPGEGDGEAAGGDDAGGGDRGRGDREERSERPRREPRARDEDRGDRGDRGDREERRPRREPREPREDREERRPRSRGGDWEDGDEPRRDRGRGRGPRREEREEVVDEAPARPARPARSPRDRDEEGDEAAARPARPSRARRDRDEEGDDRPRSRRPRRDEERDAEPRGRSDEDRPARPRRDRDEERPARPRRDRDEERPVRARADRDDDRPARPRRDRDEERPARPRRDRDEERPARPRRDRDEERPVRSRRDRDDEERPARPRRARSDEDRPRRGRDSGDEGEDRPRRPRADRDEERPRRSSRERSSMPMAEFDEPRGRSRGARDEAGPPKAELESIDSVIGDDGDEAPRPRRGGSRRPRRRD